MNDIFIQLSAILAIAVVLSLLIKLLRQPLIIAYIITGIIVGPAVFSLIPNTQALESFSHIGVALLLFMVGLGLKPSTIKEIGKTAVIGGVAQIAFTTLGGYFIARMLGFVPLTSFYLALAFALSSTIVIIRLLSKKEEQDTLYGRITVGFLVVQDVAAMIFFIVISSSASIGTGSFLDIALFMVLKFILLILGIYLLIKFVIHKIDKIFAENPELLFVFSLGICFGISAVFYKFGFSLELGALAAGITLSVSPYQRDMAAKISPLRDFFLIIFFIVMGSHIYVENIASYFPFLIFFSLFILIGNPLIIIIVLRNLKYTIRTSFYSGLAMAQISEFSLILIGMG